ncbi:cell wall biosynthesis glycosyltransferase [Nitritalea halalkaliphila LW7]|uniref:Cell wall biosynthesis glycosyltransferase n=1 Tax=Nitritalea halalkaliphila LW7 TaxID=1189621 RepID=I5C1W3_9BACT|nr:glycosyltransferase [Nitritalea halalkaliphila]EIM75815.1 cell wall biosynthesis glycosyltransferase [Nitritalea halalkaliphila LW7]
MSTTILTLFALPWLFFAFLYPLMQGLYRVRKTHFDRRSNFTSLQFQADTAVAAAATPPSIACVITAYKEGHVALPLIESLRRQRYGEQNFHIYLVADRCVSADLPASDARLTVIEPEEPLDSKLKSLHAASQAFRSEHHAVLVLDPDNLAHPQALEALAEAFSAGFEAVQGNRVAKNMDTKIAALDALGELYYTYHQRFLPYKLGSSATIAGSGMLIERHFFQNYLDRLLSTEGVVLAEDKLLQMQLVESGRRIAFQERALIFDEKSTSGAQVQRQRTRWLKSYFDHVGDVIRLGCACWRKGDRGGAFFALMIATPPFVFLVGGLALWTLVSLLGVPTLLPLFGLAWLAFLGGWVIALRGLHAPPILWEALPWIPIFAGRQVLSLLGFKQAKTDFMATSHDRVWSIAEVWKKRKADFNHLNLDA